MDECGVANHIGDRGKRVARRKEYMAVDFPDLESVAMGEEAIPLRAVGRKVRPVVDTLPELLHVDDMGTDRGGCAGLLMQVAGGRKVVGVGMGVQDPFHRQSPLPYIVEQGIRVHGGGRTGFFIIIEHRIDNRAFPGFGVRDDILDAPGPFVEKAFYLWSCGHGISFLAQVLAEKLYGPTVVGGAHLPVQSAVRMWILYIRQFVVSN